MTEETNNKKAKLIIKDVYLRHIFDKINEEIEKNEKVLEVFKEEFPYHADLYFLHFSLFEDENKNIEYEIRFKPTEKLVNFAGKISNVATECYAESKVMLSDV